MFLLELSYVCLFRWNLLRKYTLQSGKCTLCTLGAEALVETDVSDLRHVTISDTKMLARQPSQSLREGGDRYEGTESCSSDEYAM